MPVLQKNVEMVTTCVMSDEYRKSLESYGTYTPAEVKDFAEQFPYDEDRSCFIQQWSFPKEAYASISEGTGGDQLRIRVPRIDPPYPPLAHDEILVRPVGSTLGFDRNYSRIIQERMGQRLFVMESGLSVHKDKFDSSGMHHVVIVSSGEFIAFTKVDDSSNIDFESNSDLIRIFSRLDPGYEMYYQLPWRSVNFIQDIDESIRASIDGFRSQDNNQRK